VILSGERRLPAAVVGSLPTTLWSARVALKGLFRQAAEKNRLAACTPQRFRACYPGADFVETRDRFALNLGDVAYF
jgi:hypothetical protein